MNKLNPCPFCGGEAEIINIDEGENAGGSCVCCKRCLASSNVEFEFKENFVSNWNRRTPSLPASAEGVEAILHAALDCPHEIDGEKVVLKASLSKPGNALAQLSTRLSAALKAETSR